MTYKPDLLTGEGGVGKILRLLSTEQRIPNESSREALRGSA